MNGLVLEVLEEAVERCPQHGEFRRARTKDGWRGRCKQCRELEGQRIEAESEARMRAQQAIGLLSRAELPPRFASKGFDDYRPATKGQAKALAACRQYVAELDQRIDSGACLVLIGPPGVGKTHLLVALVREVAQQLVRARYATTMGFLAAVRGSWEWHAGEHGEQFVRPELLVLDELWMPQSTREAGTLMALLDERYRRKLPTLIGSNLSWLQMQEHIGARFCDRLLEGGQIVAVDGKSARAGALK